MPQGFLWHMASRELASSLLAIGSPLTSAVLIVPSMHTESLSFTTYSALLPYLNPMRHYHQHCWPIAYPVQHHFLFHHRACFHFHRHSSAHHCHHFQQSHCPGFLHLPTAIITSDLCCVVLSTLGSKQLLVVDLESFNVLLVI